MSPYDTPSMYYSSEFFCFLDCRVSFDHPDCMAVHTEENVHSICVSPDLQEKLDIFERRAQTPTEQFMNAYNLAINRVIFNR